MMIKLLKQLRRLGRNRISFAGVLFFPMVALAATQPVVIALQTGVTVLQIQSALDSLSTNGGEVVLPTGKIEVRQPIILSREGQSLRGAGDKTVLFLTDNANCPVIIMGQPVNKPKHVEHLRVSDLFIDGNRAHQQFECWQTKGDGSEIRNNGITTQNISDSVIEHVTTARCRSGGVVTTLDTRQLTVNGLNSFDNYFDGLACFLTDHCTFTNLNLHDNAHGAGISLDGNFHHNIIDDAVLARNDLGIFMRWSHDNEFRNISIRRSSHYGVFMAENIGQTAIGQTRTDCTGNSFDGLNAGECGVAVFRVNDATCTNNFVTGAKFSGDVHAQLSLAIPGLLLVK